MIYRTVQETNRANNPTSVAAAFRWYTQSAAMFALGSMTTPFARAEQINRCQSSLLHCVPGKVTIRGSLTLENRYRLSQADSRRRCTSLTGARSRQFDKAVVWGSKTTRRPRAGLKVSALFERFTEQAIKAVVRSQTEAQQLGSVEVCCAAAVVGLYPDPPSSLIICISGGARAFAAGHGSH